MNLETIGVIRSPVKEGVDAGWGSVVSEIQLSPPLQVGLKGLEQFSHILVVFYMYQSSFNAQSDLVRRPQGRADMPEVGIFAQRAKHRPNPLGVTAVKLLGVRGNVLTVQGLDAIDGTPVLDLKPYFPAFDRVESPAVPQWVNTLMAGYF
jgi:tRNA (adenine37-N6)-methyltransferase